MEDEEWRGLLIFLGALIAVVLTLLPGFAIMRLVRYGGQSLNKVLYASGFGILFMMGAGFIANFTLGFNLSSLWVVYISLLAITLVLSWKYGRGLSLNWNWRYIALPLILYLLALGLQFQTSLISANLVGSDIHLEYFHASETLIQGYWNPDYVGGTINTCLGITILLPMYTLMTNLELVWVFKVISPMIFALLPLALYVIYKSQFGLAISLLATLFFITTPMFTMDMVQLVRQQQSELFFILVVLLIMDGDIGWRKKMVIGSLFSVGAVTTHYGMSVGYIGYLVMASGLVIVITKYYRHRKHKIEDATKPILPRMVMVVMAVLSIAMYLGYYSWVNQGSAVFVSKIPITVIERTVEQFNKDISQALVVPESTKPPEATEPIEATEPTEATKPIEALTISDKGGSFFDRFPTLDPLLKEPLLQTALGLDFGRASALGKTWRILQYLVELCIIVGFFAFMFRPDRRVKMEYMAFVLASFFVVVGMFVLMTHSYGMGVTRVWLVTLLFMSPFFVIGAGAIGKGVAGWAVKNKTRLIVISTLILFVPYYIFNSGVVFELAKMESKGFIDVPYSVFLSSQRVDIATVFEKEDVEAVDWLEKHIRVTQDTHILFGDTHGARLLAQRFGWTMRGTADVGDLSVVGNVRSLKYLKDDDEGYIFLSKRNVDNNMITFQVEYGGRESMSLDDLPMIQEKISKGVVLFDNGAKVIFVQ